MAVCGDQEVLIHSGMVQVVGHGCEDSTHLFDRRQERADFILLNEAVHRLRHVRSMNTIVIGISLVITLFE
jgi:hypothetical protein